MAERERGERAVRVRADLAAIFLRARARFEGEQAKRTTRGTWAAALAEVSGRPTIDESSITDWENKTGRTPKADVLLAALILGGGDALALLDGGARDEIENIRRHLKDSS